MTEWYSSRRLAARLAAFKTVIDEEMGEIVGASVLGPDAEEIINVFAMAMQHRIRVAELSETVFAYPTASSDISSML